MLRTSVLERLCAPLCRAVLGEPGSSRALDELARTNLFLLPLDDRGRWFRFHHLFAQILRVELERREPGARPGAASPRVRVARRARHGRRGDPSRRRRGRVPRGRPPHRGELGALRQRRPDGVRARVAAPLPRSESSTPTPGCCSSRPGSRRCAAARTPCAPPSRVSASWEGSTRGRSRTASRRWSPACRCSPRRSAGATCRGSSSTACARRSSRVPTPRGGP